MTLIYMILFLLGAVALLAAICLMTVSMENQLPAREYDERQNLIWGKAYRFVFYLGAAYSLTLYGCLELGDWSLPLKTSTLLFLGLVLQALGFHIYCLAQNTGLPLKRKGGQMVKSYVLFCALNLVTVTRQIALLQIYPEYSGQNAFAIMTAPENIDFFFNRLLAMAAFATLAVVYLISAYRDQKGEDES